jgi:hypothetical protein
VINLSVHILSWFRAAAGIMTPGLVLANVMGLPGGLIPAVRAAPLAIITALRGA